MAYVFSAFLASTINLVAFLRIEDSVSETINADIRGVLAAFTAVSLIAFALQFVYARAIGVGHRGPWNLGWATALVIAGGVGALTAISIDSLFNFRISSGIWVGLATFSALLPSGLLAAHLVNEKWRPICMFVISGALIRLCLWELPNSSKSLSSLLALLTVSQVLSYLFLICLSETKASSLSPKFKLRQHKLSIGILAGLAIVISLGSIGRRGALGSFASEYSEVSLAARNIFFLAAIFSYASFPFLTTHQLFSRELGKRFRQAETLVVTTTVVLGSSVLINQSVTKDVFGVKLWSDRPLIVVSVLSWSLLSISLIPILYYVAHNSRLGLAIFLPAFMMVLGQLMTTTSRSLAVVFLCSNIILVCIALVPVLIRSRPLLKAEIARHDDFDSIQREQVTIVVPSHNSGTSGSATVLSIHEQFEAHGIDVRVIAVSDGSSDESTDLFNSMSYEWFEHIQLVENKGKGGALKKGFSRSNSEITGFIDADGDIPTHLLIPMYRELMNRDADVVFGSKWHPESTVKVAGVRRILSRVHHIIQKILFRIDIDDTQVGIKLYKTSSLKDVLPTLQEDGFSLDIEIFVALGAYGHANFVEMPVEINRQGPSTISISDVFLSFIDLLRIFWRARVSLNYESQAYTSLGETDVRKS
jgi:dolichol-phosphate mannosyltransferase